MSISHGYQEVASQLRSTQAMDKNKLGESYFCQKLSKTACVYEGSKKEERKDNFTYYLLLSDSFNHYCTCL